MKNNKTLTPTTFCPNHTHLYPSMHQSALIHFSYVPNVANNHHFMDIAKGLWGNM